METITESEIVDALESLPEEYRITVLLADVEGFAYKEIAEILDIPMGTVMSRLHRGRKTLQKAVVRVRTDQGLGGSARSRSSTGFGWHLILEAPR